MVGFSNIEAIQNQDNVTNEKKIPTITTFDCVKDESTCEYFNGNMFSIDAFNRKYTIHENETYVQAIKRVCDYIASCEKTPKLQKYWSERWFDEIYNDWWHPAGSIMQGSANPKKISLVNCTTIALKNDTLEDIFRSAAYQVAKCAAYRQGLGIDFSRLRPRNAIVNNSALKSTGVTNWMSFIDSIGKHVGQNSRVPAMLMSLSCKHFDIEEFITIKSDYTKIQNANISVQITNDFYEAVKNDDVWELCFEVLAEKKGDLRTLNVFIDDIRLTDKNGEGYYSYVKHNREKQVITKKIKARELLDLIAKNMYNNAEPGIQNIDIMHKYSNSDYVGYPIISTNACSEQALDNGGCCVLASINCGQFPILKKQRNKKLNIIATSINRFLDNVVEKELCDNRYATWEQKQSQKALRRTGAGITNIDGLLFKNNLSYGTRDGNAFIESFISQYNFYLYKASIALGKEKGSFGAFTQKKYEQSPFIQRMIKLKLDFTHMRNVCVSSIAPTGSLSLMFKQPVLSYGIEPAFGLYYWKRTRMSGKYEYYFVVPGVVNDYMKSIGHPIDLECGTIKDNWQGSKGKEIALKIDKYCKIKFKTARDISALDKLDLMSRVQKHIDSSISVTYLLNENATQEDVREFILEAHNKELKSVAAFPDKKMYGIISFEPFKDLAFNLIKEGVEISRQNFIDSEEEILRTELNDKFHETIPIDANRPNNIIYKNAPKRHKELSCDIHQYRVKGANWIILVGLLDNQPYEVFGGNAEEFIEIDRSIKRGFLTKRKITNKINRYDLQFGENGHEVTVKNISKMFNNGDYNTFTRTLSLSLRHGAPVHHIVEQLRKDDSDTFDSFSKVMSRVLKTYIKDGTKVVGGQKCNSCQSTDLFYNEGCLTCVNCGLSKCS